MQSREDRIRELRIAWLQAGPVSREQRSGLDARFAKVFKTT